MTRQSVTRLNDGGPLITYTVFPDVWPKEKTEYADMPWIELVRTLANPPHYMSKSACPLLSLCEYGDNASDKGYLRHAGNVVRCYGIEVDYDGEEVSPEEAQTRLQAAGLISVIYTSASYTDGAPRWRAILPLKDAAAPTQRALFVARANRALGGIASRESFTLSQSFYFGQVRGAKYKWYETHGRCVDEAADLEPMFHQAEGTDPKTGRDTRSNQQLLEAFARGEGRYEAMLKLSSRWAARGMAYDDVVSALNELLDSSGSSLNADGIDLRSRIEPMAASAVRKFGGTMPEVRISAALEAPADLPPVRLEDYAALPEAQGMERVIEPDTPESVAAATESALGFKVELRHVADIVDENREPEWLLHRVLEAKVVAVLAGPRASFKSFIALDWAMRIAMSGQPVAILSGEGGGLGRRVKAWMQTFGGGQELRDLPILALERPLNLNREEEMTLLVQAIDMANIRPSLVVVDTLSKFSAGMDENSNQEVAAYLAQLSRYLRERYQASVLIVAHSGHGDAARPRGASALMANPDAEYIVKRAADPGTHVEVTRQRFKDTGELPNLAYEAEVIDLGAADRYGERLTSLIMRETVAQGEKPIANQTPQGKAQRTILLALRERQKRSETPLVWTIEEMRQIGRECGLSRQSVHDAVEKLMMSPFIVASVGGSRLAAE
jgi:hypothetical protein